MPATSFELAVLLLIAVLAGLAALFAALCFLRMRLQTSALTEQAAGRILRAETDLAFGLCDLGQGFPELGGVSLTDLRYLRGKLGLPVERDLSFTAKHPMSVYAEAANRAEGITEDTSSLLQATAALAAWRRS